MTEISMRHQQPARSSILSVNTTKKQLQTIKEVENKMQSRVRYLSKEEEKVMSKISVMRSRLDSRQQLFQERDLEFERIQAARMIEL